ncbi:MAG TPA: pyrroline-5-carboxylate reductase [Cellvibrionaceae bacterium]|nr:pyrroline-5-carboxylate reductase [Cellvibrionaceae bacterium]HMW48967.1 pyrroline-5-carboxylate reductase [Cellvibrionaceae bacterium]HMW71725.1 pyrroline-5-carboxylate reductase [Cellvibrionaceae bacterium]HMY39447.1 pyrroline-5-carboxylate reductase [Marinagarivorans sp.]
MASISFIGAGNMARAIAQGLINTGTPSQQLLLTGPRPEHLSGIARELGVVTSTDNRAAVEQADTVVLCVKPQIMAAVCKEIARHLKPTSLVISVAAGIRLASLSQWLGGHRAIARAMPNTPAQIGLGATGVYASALSADQRQRVETLLAATGLVQWVEEERLIDSVTALSGSGPAYFFLFMEAMIAAAEAQGLSPASAQALCIQTALGAASLASQTGVAPAELRRRVTSPKGTTEQAIHQFETGGLKDLVKTAMDACQARAHSLADELGGAPSL